jgi:hypothetical protein
VELYATYSNITIRPDRDAVLSGAEASRGNDFGGRLVRNMVTSLYVASKAG